MWRLVSSAPTVCLPFEAKPAVMRFGLVPFVLVVSPLLFGCGPEAPVVAGVVAGAAVVVSAAGLPVFHRTPVDMLVSAATGRDCSVVNFDRGGAVLPAHGTGAGAAGVLHAITGGTGLLGEPGEAAEPPAADRRWAAEADGGAGEGPDAVVVWVVVRTA
jgi:hypothetical protein